MITKDEKNSVEFMVASAILAIFTSSDPETEALVQRCMDKYMFEHNLFVGDQFADIPEDIANVDGSSLPEEILHAISVVANQRYRIEQLLTFDFNSLGENASPSELSHHVTMTVGFYPMMYHPYVRSEIADKLKSLINWVYYEEGVLEEIPYTQKPEGLEDAVSFMRRAIKFARCRQEMERGGNKSIRRQSKALSNPSLN